MRSKTFASLGLLTAAALLATSLGAGDAAAWERQRQTSITGNNGNTATINGTVIGGAGQHSGSFTGSSSTGRSWTRNFESTRDPATGVWTRNGELTTNNGKVYNHTGTTDCDRGQGCTSNGTWTGPNGQTVETQRWIQVSPSN